MNPAQTSQIGQTSEQRTTASQPSLLAPIFISAVSVLLGLIDSINYHFQPRLIETLLVTLIGLAAVWWGVFSRRQAVTLLGSAFLFAVCCVDVGSQPSQLNISLVSVWSLRVGLLLLVLAGWFVLAAPVTWARRGLIAAAVPTLGLFSLVAGPSLASQFLDNRVVAANNFAPYWLAVNSKGTVYATNLAGNYVWVFDSSGNPVGTIRPGMAPTANTTPGPGIVPIGYEPLPNNPVGSILGQPSSTPTPQPQHFGFCGIAVDPNDYLYVADPVNYQMLRFDTGGNLQYRWPLPRDRGYQGSRGCLAADAQYVYFASRFGAIYFFDHAGAVAKTVDIAYQPFGITLDGQGNLLSLNATQIDKISIAEGKIVASMPIPAPPGQPNISYQSLVAAGPNSVLAADFGGNQLVRIDLQSSRITEKIGGTGQFAGQFQGLAGLTADAKGRIYAADWRLAVIQRFIPEGKVEAVWWAPGQGSTQVGEPGEGY